MANNSELFNSAPFSDLINTSGESSTAFVTNLSAPLPHPETWQAAAVVFVQAHMGKLGTKYALAGFNDVPQTMADAWEGFHDGVVAPIQNRHIDPEEAKLTNECFWLVADSLYYRQRIKLDKDMPGTQQDKIVKAAVGGALAYDDGSGLQIESFYAVQFKAIQFGQENAAASHFDSSMIKLVAAKLIGSSPPGEYANSQEFARQVPVTSLGLRMFTGEQLKEDLVVIKEPDSQIIELPVRPANNVIVAGQALSATA